MIGGGISGGYNGYKSAEKAGKNVWWGSKVKNGRTQYSFDPSELPHKTISVSHTPNVTSQKHYCCVAANIQNAQEFYGLEKNLTQDEIIMFEPIFDGKGNISGLGWNGAQTAADQGGLKFTLKGATIDNIASELEADHYIMGYVKLNPNSPVSHALQITKIDYFSYGEIITCWDPDNITRTLTDTKSFVTNRIIVITPK